MSAVSGGETEQVVLAPGVRPPLAVPRRLLRMRSDAALAERFAAGDEAAFDVIYERHRPVVLAVCMGVLGAPPDAEDATQETFSALAVALRTRPPAELRPWLIRVARNASIDTTRRRRHRLLTLDGEIPEVAARPSSSGKAELAVVLDGIRELPEGQRMALLMRELGGHSYSEIAEFLETDEESVKGLIARARVGLRTYREATELSCASARSTILAEPDGRRYDKTIRRHLRTCGSCRSYRDGLRDDAKALRAALPIQAGTVATGSLSSGMLTTAKGTLLGYGLTQAATTCAASACAVGAIGGMVFVAPVHKLGLPLIAPVVKAAPHKPHHAIAKAAPVKHVVIPTHTAATVYRSAAPPVSSTPTVTHVAEIPVVHPSAAVLKHRHHEPTIAKFHRASLPPVQIAPPATSGVPVGAGHPTGDPGVAGHPTGDPGVTPTSSAPPVTQSVPVQGAGHPTGDPGIAQQGTGSPTGDPGTQSYGGDRHDGPVHVIIGGVTPTAPQASAASAAPPVTASAPGTSTPGDGTDSTSHGTDSTSVVTTPPSHGRPVIGVVRRPTWQSSQYGTRHTGSWHRDAAAQPTSSASHPSATGTPTTAPAGGTPTAGTPTTTNTGTPVTSSDHSWTGGGAGQTSVQVQRYGPGTQPYHGSGAQPYRGSAQPYHGTAAQPYHGSSAQPYHGTAAQPYHGSSAQPYTSTSGQPARWSHRGWSGR